MESKPSQLKEITKEELFSLTNKDRQSVFFSKNYTFLGASVFRAFLFITPITFLYWLSFIFFIYGSSRTDNSVFTLVLIAFPISLLILIYTRELSPVQVQADGITQGKQTVSWGRIIDVTYSERSGKVIITSKTHTEKIKMHLKKASPDTKKNLGNVLQKRCEAKNIVFKVTN